MTEQTPERLEIYDAVKVYVQRKLFSTATALPHLIEATASCAIEGNKLAAQLLTTLERISNHQPVGDRWLMQLAWYLRDNADEEEELGRYS